MTTEVKATVVRIVALVLWYEQVNKLFM